MKITKAGISIYYKEPVLPWFSSFLTSFKFLGYQVITLQMQCLYCMAISVSILVQAV